jgi:MATE family multidrug resistance protein
MNLLRRFNSYWHSEAGPRDVFSLALPLFLSTSSMTVQIFVDRLFLTWYSQDAIAASIPAMCVLWVLVGPLNGIVTFANTFVAQYYGAGRLARIGPAMGQAILVAVAGGFLIVALWPVAPAIFATIGHEPSVARDEVVYFRTLLLSAAPMLLLNAVTSFFGGLGRTWLVLLLNALVTVVNLVLDYALIFGHWGLPELGIAGAGWATAAGYAVAAAVSVVLLWLADPDGIYGVRRSRTRREELNANWSDAEVPATWTGDGRRNDSVRSQPRFLLWPDYELLGRLLRFGGPNGLMVLVDVLAWTWFVLIVGRISTVALAATNVAFNINLFAFGPMIGLGTAVQIRVGQRLGEGRPDLASRSAWSAFWPAFGYTIVLSVGFLAVPDLFLAPLRWNTRPEEYAQRHDMIVVLLRYVVLYALFDTTALVFSGALRGAGDTRFVMLATLFVALGVMVIPSYFMIESWHGDIFTAWWFVTGYVIVLGGCFFGRFHLGAWRSMRVIEAAEPCMAPMTAAPANSYYAN